MTFPRSAAVCALTAALVLGGPWPVPPPAPARAEGESVSALLTRLQRLYRDAEAAGETYNAAGEELAAQTAEVRRLGGHLTRTRDALAAARDAAGRLARAQYQGRGGFSPALRLLFAGDPDHALDEALLLRRLAREQAATVARLRGGARQADAMATAARRALERNQELIAARQRARDDALAALREVEAALAGLPPQRLTELAALERDQTARAQSDLLGEAGPAGEGAPSAQGAEAVAYATGQLGKPYGAGASGPGAFDDSGLVSRAWAEAGRPVPRTSGEQWRTLPAVPLRSLRPGDLVVYYPEATHVALYAGGGRVVHVPRPGAAVAVSPLAALPVLGAVRPDAGAPPLASYTPPAGVGGGTGAGAPAGGGAAEVGGGA
ncbi:C40 family peptidase [Streptomyces fradiae]|uniref:Putative endopeptidase n=1 Tax=Streptomyces rubrolavendulae TaxID=285473 RepID=A0A1D8G6J0_9ACTN|nr:C40 family peptidase [Streptomyces rubrolavendulae]AOT61033.1 putative endopeptidase precursor [Streptomyces rubrolavendulae]